MNTLKSKTSLYGGLDRFRTAAALLVIAIHTSPLASINGSADFFLTRILARIAVPFFLMVTGQFVLADLFFPSSENNASGNLLRFLKKMALLYGLAILLYLPLGIYAGHFQGLTVGAFLRMLFFDGTFYHLWYFPACILGTILVWLFSRFMSLKAVTVLSAILYILGLMGDSYYGLAQKIPGLEAAYGFGFQVFSYTRNGIFLAPLFLVLGIWAANGEKEDAKSTSSRLFPCLAGLALSFGIMTAEAFLLRHFRLQRHDSMYLALVPVMIFLYQCLLKWKAVPSRLFRFAAAWIYLLHPAWIVAVRGLGKISGQTSLLVDNSLVHYLTVAALSSGFGFGAAYFQEKLRLLRKPCTIESSSDFWENLAGEEDPTPDRSLSDSENSPAYVSSTASPDKDTLASGHSAVGEDIPSPAAGPSSQDAAVPAAPDPAGRAWIELDPGALAHNVAFLRSVIPKGCRLMPAVKAEAYGHGAVLISKELSRLGVDAFCVAGIQEGIDLRKAGITGEILILGYTAPQDFPLLERYQLIQSVLDYPYALALESCGLPLHVHIAVDTGMHRQGIRCEHHREIAAVYKMKNLSVDGIFTHLSASDSLRPRERDFTAGQLEAFFYVISLLEEQGIVCKGIHIVASSGMLNLLYRKPEPGFPAPEQIAGDYVRPGIVLYGMLSSRPDSDAWREFVRPVLSLKARITSIRMLYAGEAAGYGLAFTAEQDMRIATIAIGYADGLPRELSNGKGGVLIDGCRAPIIGRICMDQTIVDVSHIPHIRPGDIAVIIGKSGTQEITADALAQQCGTIANETLTRLGARLERFMLPR
ncbi:MAG: serine racemase VanT catalytic subunit [Acetatifactor sp.]|nr:serine racemase VanT catalytic subunit [Acetatifactor sp.]MDE7355106.1 serine racemase VanT catalytic subunit [Acetatifactor sp.]